MSARTLARISNDFEPSEQSMAPDALLSTAEVAELLSLTPVGVRKRAWHLNLYLCASRGKPRYWTPDQVERLRAAP